MNRTVAFCFGAMMLTAASSSFSQRAPMEVKIDEGRLQRLAGHTSDSVETLKAVVATNPDSFRAQYNLALALSQTDQKDATQKAFDAAEKLVGTQSTPDATIYNSYGWFLLEEGKLTEAKQQFDLGVQHADLLPDKSKERLFNNLGVYYLQTHQFDQAESTFQRAAKDFGSDGAKKNLALIAKIKADAAQGSGQGFIYVGETNVSGTAWVPGPSAASNDSKLPLKANDELRVLQDVSVRAEADLSAKQIGALKAGNAVQILEVRESPSPAGGKYVWAKVKS